MATYAIGDIQGCFATLEALLHRIGFDPARDRAISVGDLVNRGPGSLAALRWAMRNEGPVAMVLGNHDVHLIGRLLGVKRAKRCDTLDDVLDAPDRDEILAWLRSRPLALRVEGGLIVHAGLIPQWRIADALDLAGEAERALRGAAAEDLIRSVGERPGVVWSDDLAGRQRLRAIVQGFTMVRTCASDGRPELDFSGPPGEAPQGCRPWFECREPQADDPPVVFGHWAALGLHVSPHAIGIDSGVGWGRALTALRLEDHALFHEPVVDRLAPVAPADGEASTG